MTPEAGCPEDNVLAAFLDHRLAPRERTALEGHLAACDPCRAVWTEAVALRGGASRAVPRRVLRIAWAAAALLLVGVGAAALALPRARPATDQDLLAAAATVRAARPDLFEGFEPIAATERAAAAPTRLRGTLAVLRPAGTVIGNPRTVDWVAGAGATGHEVTIAPEGGAVLWRHTAAAGVTSVPFAGGEVPVLAPGRAYVVRVESRGPLGKAEAERRFTVAGEAEVARYAAAARALRERVPGDLSAVLQAQVAARRGLLLEAERLLLLWTTGEPGDALAKDTLLWVRRRLGVPEP